MALLHFRLTQVLCNGWLKFQRLVPIPLSMHSRSMPCKVVTCPIVMIIIRADPPAKYDVSIIVSAWSLSAPHVAHTLLMNN